MRIVFRTTQKRTHATLYNSSHHDLHHALDPMPARSSRPPPVPHARLSGLVPEPMGPGFPWISLDFLGYPRDVPGMFRDILVISRDIPGYPGISVEN